MTVSALAAIALFILLFGAISRRIESTPLSPPILFTLFGLAIGTPGLGLIDLDPASQPVRLLAEIALALILFTDASRIDLQALRDEYNLPARLLGLALPLVVLFGGLGARWLLPELNVWEAVALATILAPTDAALSQAVVSSPSVPLRIRQAINVESGLNDGLCLPLLLIALSLATNETQTATSDWLALTAKQVLLGPFTGIAVGYAGGWLISVASQRGWVTESFQDLAALGISLLAFGGAETMGGNGLLAAFAAGLILGNTARPLCNCLYEFGEAEGQLLVLLFFTIYGAILVAPALAALRPAMLLYAAFSLLVARSLAVVASALGLGLQWETLLFVGWFGPRGIASILYVLLLLENSSLPHQTTLVATAIATVGLSIFAHGLTAYPASQWYGQRLHVERQPTAREHEPARDLPVRLPLSGQSHRSRRRS